MHKKEMERDTKTTPSIFLYCEVMHVKQYRHLYMLGGTLLVCFILLATTYHTSYIETFDDVVSNYIQSFRHPYLTAYFIWMSYIGSKKVYFPLLLIGVMYLFIRKQFMSALLLAVNLYGSRYINSMLKLWYERTRPDVSPLITVTGYSFPSGHAMNAVAFLGFIAYMTITEHRITLHKKVLIIVTASFVIFSISLSRIYLGVHYPSDIVAGWAAGGSWLVLCIIFHQVFVKKEPTTA